MASRKFRDITYLFHNPGKEDKDETFSGEWPFGGRILVKPRYIKDPNGELCAPPDNQPGWVLTWSDEHHVDDYDQN